jgi:hypothetical protein
MDSIVRGKPIPKIFIRQEINPKTKKTMREVVDGQQRLRTIFSFLQDGFKISKTHSPDYGGKFYSELPEAIQTGILKYELSVDLLLDAPDKEVLDIFARLNSYSVKLNAQELRNATYFGEFKTLAYTLGLEYTSFWSENRIFTDAQILRMDETELVSDLLIAAFDGIKSRKAIEAYYKDYDDELKEKNRLGKDFRKTMDTIGALSAGALGESPFRSPVLFYSLYCAVYHHIHGLPKLSVTRKSFKEAQYPKVWSVLESVDVTIRKQNPTGAEAAFVDSLQRHTTDEAVRVTRTEYLAKLIAKGL